MGRFYVVGGKQRKGAAWGKEYSAYERAVILEVDTNLGTIEKKVDYVSPPDVCASGSPAILFKAATLDHGRLYTCTQTEVLVYSVPDFRLEEYLSIPCFNDLHHVRPSPDGALLVANTGLDMVVKAGYDGEIQSVWNALGEELWARFSRDTDYRKVLTTQPHRSHPNYVFLLNDDTWVSRFHQKDAICLTGDGRMNIGVERVHDGLVRNGFVYFTTVNGTLNIYDVERSVLCDPIDLNEIVSPYGGGSLGWCRAVEVIDERYVVVGFSRIRNTRFRENLRWLKDTTLGQEAKRSLPTRISMFDLKDRRLCWEMDLEDAGMNAIFSIHQIV